MAESRLPPNEPSEIKGKRVWDVIVIGCGPTGICVAIEARIRGLSVLVVEKKEMMSTVIEKFPKGKPVYMSYLGVAIEFIGNVTFPDELSKDEFVQACRDYHKAYGFELHEGEEITDIKRHDKEDILECQGKQSYWGKTVMFAIGIFGRPNTLPITIPPPCKSRIHYDLDDPAKYKGQEILVVGGGDTTAETTEYLQENNKVTVSYRRPAFLKGERLSLRNYTNLYKSLENKKIEVLFNTNITSIEPVDDKGSIKLKIKSTDGKKIERKFQSVFLCLGGTPPITFMNKINLKLDGRTPKLTKAFEAVNIPGLYILGDVAHIMEIKDGKTVVEKKTIVNSLKHTVYAIEDVCKKHVKAKVDPPVVIPLEKVSPLLVE